MEGSMEDGQALYDKALFAEELGEDEEEIDFD